MATIGRPSTLHARVPAVGGREVVLSGADVALNGSSRSTGSPGSEPTAFDELGGARRRRTRYGIWPSAVNHPRRCRPSVVADLAGGERTSSNIAIEAAPIRWLVPVEYGGFERVLGASCSGLIGFDRLGRCRSILQLGLT